MISKIKFLQNTQEKVLQFLEIVALETTKVHGGLEFFKFKRIQRKFEIRSQRFFKIVVLKNFANSQENTCVRVSFLIKLQA